MQRKTKNIISIVIILLLCVVIVFTGYLSAKSSNNSNNIPNMSQNGNQPPEMSNGDNLLKYTKTKATTTTNGKSKVNYQMKDKVGNTTNCSVEVNRYITYRKHTRSANYCRNETLFGCEVRNTCTVNTTWNSCKTRYNNCQGGWTSCTGYHYFYKDRFGSHTGSCIYNSSSSAYYACTTIRRPGGFNTECTAEPCTNTQCSWNSCKTGCPTCGCTGGWNTAVVQDSRCSCALARQGICSYSAWSGWSAWGTGNYCNTDLCQAESQYWYN